jgi:hypothetical protein
MSAVAVRGRGRFALATSHLTPRQRRLRAPSASGAGSSVDLDVIAGPSRANPARDGLPDALDSDAFAASADINREQAIRSSRAW